MKNSERVHDAAESSFKKRERRITEGRKAMAEHDAAARAVDANTARLRALRLARDAAEALAPKTVKASSAKKKTPAKKIAAAPIPAAPIPAAPIPVAAVIEPEGETQQLLQEDHLTMADRDGVRSPTARTTSNRIKTSDSD
jgi:hypothetical protein